MASQLSGQPPRRLEAPLAAPAPAGPQALPRRARNLVREVVARPGEPLDASSQAVFARRFHNLARVRVHTDAQAARSARSIGARAYAVGDHIAFAAGAYSPSTDSGQRLLAHELAHTLQADNNGTVRRSPSGEAPVEAAGEGTPVELPEHIAPETDALARDTAERIDDVIERDWNRALHSGTAALLTALEVEGILREVFEMGHGAQPQLGERNAPVLQYHVSLHPGLRERLTVLRQMAGGRHTERIGRYLDIPVGAGDAYHYEIWMFGLSGGEGVEATRQLVVIRYLENGEQQWRRSYDFLGAGGGVGLAPGVISGDIKWNAFYAPEDRSPEDFEGPMTVVGAGGGFIIGWEVEGALLSGNGKHAPISADIGGVMLTSLDVGAGSFTGRLIPWLGRPVPAPGPGHGVLPPTPPFVQRPEVREQIRIFFETGQSRLDETGRRDLARFFDRWQDVFSGGLFKLQLIGYASRTGRTTRNQHLSEERVWAVREYFEDRLGHRLDEAHVATQAVGEELALLEGRDEEDDSASDRVVEVSLVGRLTLPVRPR